MLKQKWKKFILLLGLVFLFVFSVNFYIHLITKSHIFTNIADVPKSQVALVLGARVMDGRMSDILSDRTKTALSLYKADRVEKILVSGDHGRKEYDEVINQPLNSTLHTSHF